MSETLAIELPCEVAIRLAETKWFGHDFRVLADACHEAIEADLNEPLHFAGMNVIDDAAVPVGHIEFKLIETTRTICSCCDGIGTLAADPNTEATP